MTQGWPGRLEQTLQQDLSLVSKPDLNRPFSSSEDAFRRLIPYHVFALEEEDPETVTPSLANTEKLAATARQTKAKLEALKERLKVEGDPARLRRASEECFLENLQLQNERAIAAQLANPTPSPWPATQLPQLLLAPPTGQQAPQQQPQAPLSQLQGGWRPVGQPQQQPPTQAQSSKPPQSGGWVQVQQPGAVNASQPESKPQGALRTSQTQGGWHTVQPSQPAQGQTPSAPLGQPGSLNSLVPAVKDETIKKEGL